MTATKPAFVTGDSIRGYRLVICTARAPIYRRALAGAIFERYRPAQNIANAINAAPA